MKLRNLNHISELLKIENRKAEMFTPWGPVVGSFQHTLWPLRRASEAAILLSLAFAFVISWYRVIIAPSLCSGALQYTVYTSITGGQDSLSKIFISSSNISVRTWGSLEKKQQYQYGRCKMQTADCRPGTKCRLRTGYKMHTEISYCFFRLIRDNMPAYNVPSVTQSFFHDHLSRLFALLCNIPCPFLDHNRS